MLIWTASLFKKKKAFFFFLTAPQGLWNLSSLTRDQTQASAVKVQSPNDWPTKNSQDNSFF